MTWLKHSSSSRWHADRWLAPSLGLTAAGAALILGLVLAFLLREAAPVLGSGHVIGFLTDPGWYPLEGQFGMLPMVVASLAAALGAVLLAGPLGVVSAIFLRFYAPPGIARVYRMIVALLAGIPSVVFGLWGLTVLVPLIARWQPPGASLLAAILILALMVLPTVALTSASALAAVPQSLLQGASALGIRPQGTILQVAVPAARGGIVNGMLLACARALGETMAVLMVAGNVVQYPTGLFEPVRVLTANIALEMAYATGAHRAGLFAAGLLLTLLVMLLAWLAIHANRGRGHV
ncbi:MAG: phosphate ABC transporter permease subunit PstC [Betaproteobacteria bacterium HGW-Betaproteobacteria-3]|jgi:phosphate transport system permease protein|nr:MAG: phosphate ABC transporter permease subunit PstC [Betaproteobacteria bacterium HGW-Betaproteobacteria-3]